MLLPEQANYNNFSLVGQTILYFIWWKEKQKWAIGYLV